MQLWVEWWKVVACLRPACSRTRSFMWLVVALVGFSVRSDLLGVTSIVRGLGLKGHCYDSQIRFFHSTAIDPDCLARLWVKIVLRVFPSVFRFNGRLVLLGDGIKVSKSGQKMPGVKCLHQESDSNTKPEYIMGHSCQAISLVVGAGNSAFAVPLISRIHEGLVFSNRDKRKLPKKMALMIGALEIANPIYFVGDAYYACQSIARDLLDQDDHLISRVRNNAVAYMQVSPETNQKKRRGRPKFYGKKIKLFSLFDETKQMITTASPVYGEVGVNIQYRSVELIWKPLGRLVQFVLVIHPARGQCIFICTDLTLPPIDIIRLYGVRFKIELAFKQALLLMTVQTRVNLAARDHKQNTFRPRLIPTRLRPN